MNDHNIIEPAAKAATVVVTPAQAHRNRGAVVAALLALTLVFGPWLIDLVRFAVQSELYSHIPLIPIVSLYLVWIRRHALPTAGQPAVTVSAMAVATAVLLMAAYFLRDGVSEETAFALTTASYLLLVVAAIGLLLGRVALRFLAFPLGFLVFMIPVPTLWMTGIETVLQHGSATVARGLFMISGTALHYQDLSLQLPGITLHVAPECSGIHSSLALLIVSVLGGHWFLRSPVRAAVLAAAVFPLALLRNGLRVFVIGELCVARGPHMIDSAIHRHGGPVFFALSLIPFFALLWFLARGERKRLSR